MIGRSVGLSRTQHPPQLLKIIKGRSVPTSDDLATNDIPLKSTRSWSDDNESMSKRGRTTSGPLADPEKHSIQIREPDSFDAPPLSTSGEESDAGEETEDTPDARKRPQTDGSHRAGFVHTESPQLETALKYNFSSSDDDNTAAPRGEIRQSQFKRTRKIPSQAPVPKRSRRNITNPQDSSSQDGAAEESNGGQRQSSRSPGNGITDDQRNEAGSQFRSLVGFTKSNIGRTGYGKTGKKPQLRAPSTGLSTTPCVEGKTKSIAGLTSLAPENKAKFISHDFIKSPGNSQRNKDTFVTSGVLSDSSPERRTRFRSYQQGLEDSPLSSPVRPTRRARTRGEVIIEKSEEDASKVPNSMRSTRSTRARKAKSSVPKASQPAVFKMPEGISDMDFSAQDLVGSPQSSIVDMNADTDNDEQRNEKTVSEVPTRKQLSVCPMCNEEVDPTLLKKFSKGSWMNIGMQARFCRLHKKNSAEETWKSRGYPKINWKKLDSRMTTHHEFLRNILEGAESHYGSILSKQIKAGKSRTLLKSDEALAPGYYGPRGLRAMSENIMKQFSALLRTRAVKDRLVSARGYAGYVQSVLVPELAVRLIMDDMKVDASSARDILEESVAIGELLYDDAEDTVAG
jgi:hypothetical protein